MNSRIDDIFNLLGKLNARRISNFLKIYLSYQVSRLTGRLVPLGKPFTLSVEPTTSCNLHCPECPSGLRKFTRPTGAMDIEQFRSIIDQTWRDMFYLNLYFQGEPYLNPFFFDFINYAKDKKIYTCASTNGHFLSGDFPLKTVASGLDRLIVSLDGTDQSSYEKYRVGGSFDKVIRGITDLISEKKINNSRTPYVIMQFIVFRSNEHQVREAKRLAQELGVDRLEIKTAQFYNYTKGNPLMTADSRHSRYIKTPGDDYRVNHDLPDHCLRMWRGSVITWDGIVVPCCFDKDAIYRLGDLKSESFQEIWKGEKYREFRYRILSERRSVDICNNCTEG